MIAAYTGADGTLLAWRDGQSVQPLIGSVKEPGEDNSNPVSDGNALSWLRGRGKYFQNGELWKTFDLVSVPLPIKQLPVYPKVVRRFSVNGTAALYGAHGGLCVGGASRFEGSNVVSHLRVVRLTDGRMWTLPLQSGVREVKVLYMTDHEVAIAEISGSVQHFSAIVRYDLQKLGPGELPAEGDAGPDGDGG